MNLNNHHSQGYWFVLREDQSNVIFSSTNNFTIQQNPQIVSQEGRYIVDTGEGRQFIQIDDAPIGPVIGEEVVTENVDTTTTTTHTDDTHFWDRNKIKLFLTMCLENNLRNINKDKDLVEIIAAHIGTTPDECIIKYKNLRRTFIRLLKKKRLGKNIKWVHYNICEKVFSECKSLPPSVLEPWDEHKVKNLLNVYIENLHRFRSSDCLLKDVWKDIAAQIGTTEYNCYHKFKNLKRAYFKWQQRSRETGKPVKWPYIQYFERIFYNFTPKLGPWNRNKTRKLIDAYIQMADKFRNPAYRKKDLWREISVIVGESAANCDKKFRNLKQTYIKLRMRYESGRTMTKWRYFKDFETIYKPLNQWDGETTKLRGDDYVKLLLGFYIDNIDKFRDPRIKKKHVWRMISPKLGLSSEGCDRKFRNLKQTYLRLLERKLSSGKMSNWPYYHYFEKIFDEPMMHHTQDSIGDVRNVCAEDVTRVVQQIRHKSDDDKFDKLVCAMEDSNKIQKERNRILLALLNRHAI